MPPPEVHFWGAVLVQRNFGPPFNSVVTVVARPVSLACVALGIVYFGRSNCVIAGALICISIGFSLPLEFRECLVCRVAFLTPSVGYKSGVSEALDRTPFGSAQDCMRATS
jgi:hypothetical protein